MKNILKPFIALLLAPVLLAPVIAPATAQGECLSGRDTQRMIASGEIMPLESALAQAGVGSDQQILSAQVCDQGRWVYVVAVLGPGGYAQNLVLPASY
jgi:hypothetical protein